MTWEWGPEQEPVVLPSLASLQAAYQAKRRAWAEEIGRPIPEQRPATGRAGSTDILRGGRAD